MRIDETASQFQTISGNRVSKSATLACVERRISQHTYETGVIVAAYWRHFALLGAE